MGLKGQGLKNRVGEVFNTNQGSQGEITKYFGATNCTVKFSDGTILHNVHYSRIKHKTLCNPNHITVCKVGFLGQGSYNTSSKNYYSIWSGMLERCYDLKYQEKYPTYKGCQVSKE